MKPYFMDLLIMLKSTFLNMDLPLNGFLFTEICHQNSLNLNAIENLFGANLDWKWIRKIKIDFSSDNYWIWGPSNHCATIVSSVDTSLTSDVSS